MKKLIVISTLLVAILSFSGCGIPQEEFDAVISEQDATQADVKALQEEVNALQADVSQSREQIDTLKRDLSDAEDELDFTDNQLSSLRDNLDAVKSELSETKEQLSKMEMLYGEQTLTVKLGTLAFINGGPFDKGDRIYGEYDLIDPEDEGYTIIGHYIYASIRTTPLGETPVGWYASEHFYLDGLGTIETVGEGPPWGGAIIGGTGVFVGASGEWHSNCTDGECYLTFIFNNFKR